MTREEMLLQINGILDDPEKRRRVDGIVPLLQAKWELPIMLEICRFDVLRFGEIKQRFPGITNAALASALRNLEGWGLLTRTQYDEIPPRVEYAPTAKGKSLLPVCHAILAWGLGNDLGK